MTMQDPRDAVRQCFDAVSRRDFDSLRQLYHSQYTYTAGNGQRQEGPEAGIAIVRTYTSAFPDLQFEIKHMHAAGDTVITEFVVQGTHRGELSGLAPTGRRITLPICNIVEVRDGKVVAEREYFDGAHLMEQLGVSAGAEQG